MSRLRTNIITNRMANGAPTVSNGLVISGVTTTSEVNVGAGVTLNVYGGATYSGIITCPNVSVASSVTATTYYGSGANLTGIDLGAVTGATGDFSIADKIVHTGDTNTAIRFPAADTITSETGGSERFRIDSSGHLHTGYTSGFGNDHINILASDGGGIAIAQQNSGNATSGTVIGSLSIQGYLNGANYTSAEARISGVAAANHTGSSAATDMVFYTKPSSTGPGSAPTERLRITSDGKLTMSSGTVELQSHMVRVGNRTTTQINAGVSTATGSLTLDTTTNTLRYYANSQWATVKKQANDGSSQNLAARSAKALLDDGITSNGVYWLDMHGAYSLGNAKRHYCLMDSSYDGGGWTMLYSMNHGNNFASGTNYSFSVNVGSPVTVSDFTAGNWGYDRRNTFTPAANDQFLIRRTDNNDWKRFVVTTWSPTANSVSNGWETLNRTDGNNTGHPYWALGQMYDASGNAVANHTHFNGCAKGGNCGSGGGDGSGFGDYSQWTNGHGDSAYGGAYNSQGNGGSPLYWGNQNPLSQGGSLYVQMFYRKAGTQ